LGDTSISSIEIKAAGSKMSVGLVWLKVEEDPRRIKKYQPVKEVMKMTGLECLVKLEMQVPMILSIILPHCPKSHACERLPAAHSQD